MITMKQARRECPGTERTYKPSKVDRIRHVLDKKGKVIEGPEGVFQTQIVREIKEPRRLLEPFKPWARRTYDATPPNQLSPKLRRIVHGPKP